MGKKDRLERFEKAFETIRRFINRSDKTDKKQDNPQSTPKQRGEEPSPRPTGSGDPTPVVPEATPEPAAPIDIESLDEVIEMDEVPDGTLLPTPPPVATSEDASAGSGGLEGVTGGDDVSGAIPVQPDAPATPQTVPANTTPVAVPEAGRNADSVPLDTDLDFGKDTTAPELDATDVDKAPSDGSPIDTPDPEDNTGGQSGAPAVAEPPLSAPEEAVPTPATPGIEFPANTPDPSKEVEQIRAYKANQGVREQQDSPRPRAGNTEPMPEAEAPTPTPTPSVPDQTQDPDQVPSR